MSFQRTVIIPTGKTSKGLSDPKLAVGSGAIRDALHRAAVQDQQVSRRIIKRDCLQDPITAAQIEMFEDPKLAGLRGADTALFSIGAHKPAGSSVTGQTVKAQAPTLVA